MGVLYLSHGASMVLVTSSVLIILLGLFAKISSDGGFTGARYFEKVGSGVLVALYGLIYGVAWYYCLAVIALNFAVRTLPLTKKGSSIWNAPWWIPIVSFINGLIPMVLGLPDKWLFSLMLAFGYMAFSSTLIFASNIKKTAEDAKWTWIRMANGFLLGIVCVLTVIGGLAQ